MNFPLVLRVPHSVISSFIEQCVESPALIVDMNNKILGMNTLCSKALGFSQREWLNQPLQTIISIDSPIQHWLIKHYDESRQHIDTHSVDIWHQDGQKLTAKMTVVALESTEQATSENRLFGFIIVFNDFPNRSPLNLLQQFSGSFLKDVNLGVMLINKEFKLVEISDMACDILGVDRQEIKDKPMEEVFASVPNEHRLVQRTILDGLIIRNHAVSWMNNDKRYELLMDSNVLKNSEGETVGAYVIFKDVSNLRSLEEQVQRSDRLAMIGQIAAGTAHEIRNPLTSIKGFLQVLNTSLSEHGLVKEQGFTEIMLKEINRINELVSEFLLLSKQRTISYAPVDLQHVIQEIMPIINNEAIMYDVSVTYEPCEGIPEIIADREMLKQVFLNLCKNGIEAMKSTGGHLWIKERINYTDRQILIDVQDTGPGIPSFLVDKIFDPFFTTKEDGTGLGLSVCQRIIHDLGGTVRLSSKGYGTMFTISLPFTTD